MSYVTGYWRALNYIVEGGLVNMPDPQSKPAKFIEWSEDICGLLAYIYEKDFDTVTTDLQERMGLTDDDEVPEL